LSFYGFLRRREVAGREVVSDSGIMPSRISADLAAFSKKIVEKIREAGRRRRKKNVGHRCSPFFLQPI
jgi:hypothetical protein